MINDKKEEAFANMIESLSIDTLSGMFPAMNVNSVKVLLEEKGYTAKVTYDDGVIAYPTFWSKSKKQVYLVVLDWAIEIYNQATDERNYGLLFYAHGYNGRLQDETKQLCERRGIEII